MLTPLYEATGSSNEFLSPRCFLPQLSSSAKLFTYKAEVSQDIQMTVPVVQRSLCVTVWTSCIELRRVYEIKTYACMSSLTQTSNTFVKKKAYYHETSCH